MKTKYLQSGLGLACLLVFFLFGLYIFSSLSSGAGKTKSLHASFTNIDGISVGSDVKISGMKVGTVENISLNSNYSAVLSIAVLDEILIPDDSSLGIETSGIFGGRYVALNPGSSPDYLVDGDEIYFTQSALNLEGIVRKFLVGKTSA